MKFYIILFMVCGFATNVMGGQPYKCESLRGDCFRGGLRNPNQNGSALAQVRSNISTSNQAYFNTRQAPAKSQLSLRSATPVSITEQNMLNLMSVGRVEHNLMYGLSRTISMNIGIANNVNAQTWTLPNTAPLTTPDEDVSRQFIAPVNVTPAGAQVAGATHVRKTTFLNDLNESVTLYKHYYMETGDELDELGSTFVENGVVYDYDEPSQIFTDAPLDLGDAFQTSVTDYEDEDDYPRTTAVCDVVVDGFGSITTPFGNTYQCLRLSLTRVQTRYTNPTTSATETDYMVAWVTPEGFRFYATKPTKSASGTTTLTKLEMYYFENAVLGVELLSFEGENAQNGVDLTWKTANEKNNMGFDIERSTDGQVFKKIGFVKGNGTTNAQNTYTFTDKNSFLGLGANYYRLRQIDFDGSTVTSNVISIQPKDSGKGIKIYPNPTSDNLITVDCAADTEGVSVINALGQMVFQQKTVGQNRLQLDVSAWAKGIYFIKTANKMVTFVKN